MLKAEIGKTAGEVWRYLGKKGKASLTELPAEVKVNPDLVNQALGWLAREEKVKFIKQGKTMQVLLTDHEMHLFKLNQIVPPCCM
jgi:hypothetical protein